MRIVGGGVLSWQDLQSFQIAEHKPHARRADYTWAFSDRILRLVVSSHIARMASSHRLPTTLEEVRQLEAIALRTLAASTSEEYHKLIRTAAAAGGLAAFYTALIYRSIRLGEDCVTVAVALKSTPLAVRQALWRLNKEAHSLLAGEIPFTKRKYKGRRRGTRIYARLWNKKKVMEMREAGATQQEIATYFGVTRRALRSVLNGTPKAKGWSQSRKFDHQLAYKLREAGLTFQDIADQLGVAVGSIQYAIKREKKKAAA